MLKPMAPPGGGMFPPQLSPQHMAMLGGVHPHMQQFQLVRVKTSVCHDASECSDVLS